MDLLQPLLAVALVLGLLWAAVHFLKGRKLAMPAVLGRAARKEQSLEILGRLPLTANHTICRIRYGERNLLLGLYPNGMVLLTESSFPGGAGSSDLDFHAGGSAIR